MRTSTTRADYIGVRLEAIKAYSKERAEKDKALIEELVKALEPFAAILTDKNLDEGLSISQVLTVGDFRRANEALSRAKEAGYG